MKRIRLCGVLALVAIAACGQTGGAATTAAPSRIGQPAGVLIEAEARAGGVRTVDDADASGGKALTTDREWQPLFNADVPQGDVPQGDASQGESFTLWVRHRGGPLLVKTLRGGGQTEIKQIWDKPASWTWTDAGRYGRTELGESVLIIRGGKSTGPDPMIDCVVFAADAAARPRAATVSAPITTSIDWKTVKFSTNRFSFGLNAFAAFDPQNAANAKYQSNMAYMAPGLVRFHSLEMMADSTKPNGWLDHETKTWDAAKIKNAVAAWKPKAVVMLSIPSFPSWMDADKDGFLDAGQLDAWAKMCADLVRIVNIEAKRGVALWEAPNEPDRYWTAENGQPERLDELIALYNAAARAMKQADPTIKTGGPALAQMNPARLPLFRRFVQGSKDNLDFFTYHVYVSGDAKDADQAIYDRAAGLSWAPGLLAAMLKEEVPARHIPLYLGEYNISWSWETRDPRMTNHKSAVFDALAMFAAAQGGADGTLAWNERDGIYGKMSGDYTLRPAAHLFHLFNAHAIGQVCQSSSSDQAKIVLYAIKSAANRRTVIVINRSNEIRSVRLDMGVYPAAKALRRHEISANGPANSLVAAQILRAAIVVPEHSVTMLCDEPAGPAQ